MRRFQFQGHIDVADDCSQRELLARLSICVKQYKDGVIDANERSDFRILVEERAELPEPEQPL